jgi:outer membrane protein
MKRLFFLFVFSTFLVCTIYSQTEAGKFHISANSDLSYSATKSKFQYDGETIGEATKVSNFSIKPTVGYFVTDGLALGLSFDFESTSYESSTSSSIMAGPYVKYYLGGTNIKPFVQGDLLVGKVDDANISGSDIAGGVAVFLNDVVSLEFGIGYGNVSLIDPDDTKAKYKTSGFALVGGFSISL